MQTQTQSNKPAEATGEISIMGREGDSKHFWDKGTPIEVKIASKVFKQYRKKGYAAFSMTEKGDKGEIIREFDPNAGVILFVPPLQGG